MVAIIASIAAYDGNARETLLNKGVICEATRTRAEVKTSASGTIRYLHDGDMDCGGRTIELNKRKNFPDKITPDEFVFGRKWKCDQYQTAVFRQQKFRACQLV